MELAIYLKTYHITPAEFALRLGVKSRSTIYRYMSGERIPCSDILAKIFELSNGQVSDADFTLKYSYKRIVANTNRNHVACILSHELADRAEVAFYDLNAFSYEAAANENLTYPVWQAKQILGSRLQLDPKGEVFLDQRPSTIPQAIKTANDILAKVGQAAIYYPGIQALHDRSSPHMKICFDCPK